MTSPCTQNMGIVKDLLTYIGLNFYLEPDSIGILGTVAQSFCIGVSFYIDPSSWLLYTGLIMCSTKKRNPLSFIVAASTIISLIYLNGNVQEQWNNIVNILTVKDHSENIGIYFYISIEIFKEHIDFFITAYLIFTFVILLQIR